MAKEDSPFPVPKLVDGLWHRAIFDLDVVYYARTHRLGGTFKIESSPGNGTYAVISISKTP